MSPAYPIMAKLPEKSVRDAIYELFFGFVTSSTKRSL
jgi:hypothetical protein